MSLWRTNLLERLRSAGFNPDESRFLSVRTADNPMMLWIELGFVFKAAHRNDEDSLIRLIYEYALWCVAEAPRGSDAGHDPATAAVVAFFEHLPEDLQARRRIHEFMSFDQMDAVKESFRYHLDNDQFGELMDELRDQYKKSRNSRI